MRDGASRSDPAVLHRVSARRLTPLTLLATLVLGALVGTSIAGRR